MNDKIMMENKEVISKFIFSEDAMFQNAILPKNKTR